MAKVKRLLANWRQVGSLSERDGAGEDFDDYEVGKPNFKKEVITNIEEHVPTNGMELHNFVITYDNGRVIKVFNPNYVEYFPVDQCNNLK